MQCPSFCEATPLEKTFSCFKVGFSSETAEEESYDASALIIGFFGQLLKKSDSRMIMGESKER